MYEAGSEEQAYARSTRLSGPDDSRLCPRCVTDGVTQAMLDHLKFNNPVIDAYVRKRLLEDRSDDDDTLDDLGEG